MGKEKKYKEKIMPVIQHTVKSSESDQRLDRFLMRLFPGLTNGQIQKLCRTGQLRVNGKRIKADHRIETGEVIRIPPLPIHSPQKEKPDTSSLTKKDIQFIKSIILYEDDFIIAFNKPEGLATQGGPKQTVHLDRYLPGLVNEGIEAPKLVHRLDKDTSGVIIVAKSRQTAKYFMHAFQQHKIQKQYLAVVIGRPSKNTGTIDAPVLKKHTGSGDRMFIDDEGQNAITHYEVLDALNDELSLILLSPQTGRQHQLRVHLEHLGTPILGDPRYGRQTALKHHKDVFTQLHLHAASIGLVTPDGKKLNLTAPLAQHIRQTCKDFNLSIPKNWI